MVAGWAVKSQPMRKVEKGILFMFLALAANSASAQEATFQFRNPSVVNRPQELIELDRSTIEKKLGKIPAGQFVAVSGTATPLTLQFDDLNQDGEWEKMVFLYTFKAKQSVNLKFKISVVNHLSDKSLAHVRQRRKKEDNSFGTSLATDSVPAGQPNTDFSKAKLPPYLTEGPAWENDKVGFRIYMDVRNIKDIWGKTTSAMMMDTVGVDPSVIYHHLEPWGMDILAVGKSLGAGSLALRVPVKGKADTLVRLGGPNMGKIIYRKIADGPVRAVFNMEYPAWNVLGDGQLTSLTEQVSIWGGQYFYESKVFLQNAPKGAQVVTGIVNLKSAKSLELSVGKAKILYSFDQQSENKDNLGMAVLVSSDVLNNFGKTPNKNTEILNTYTIALKLPPAQKSVSFRYYSCWERTNPAFATESGFKDFLTAEAENYNAAILII